MVYYLLGVFYLSKLLLPGFLQIKVILYAARITPTTMTEVLNIISLHLIFEPLIPFQTHMKSTTNNITVNAAASTLPQTSEASVSSTQQSSVSSPPQEQPAAAQSQEITSRDTMARPGPSHVRTYLHEHVSAYILSTS